VGNFIKVKTYDPGAASSSRATPHFPLIFRVDRAPAQHQDAGRPPVSSHASSLLIS
jgi:hypothetical protein